MRLLLACLAILTLAPVARSADKAGLSYADGLTPKKLVLAIGIDQFQDPLWRTLRYARRDAQTVYDAFLTKDVGFDGGQLLNSAAGTKSAEVFQALARLATDNRNEEDTVVVYLSMHGTVAYRPDGHIGRYIITTDTDSQNVAGTAVDYEKLVEAFQQLHSRKKVLILAFCHSGVGKSALTPEMKRALAQIKGPYFDEPIQERSEGSIILTASGWQEPALEDEALQGDVYTHFLVEGFSHDTNDDGAVTVTEAHEYAAERTYQYTKGRQRPSAIVELLGADPIIVKGERRRSRAAVLYSLMQRFSGLEVFVDGEPKGSLEKGVSIPEGRVRLRLEDPATKAVVAERAVTFRAGKEYSVADLLVPRLANTLVVGAAVQGFERRDFRQQFAPSDLSGVRLRYQREEALGIFDLGVEAAYFPETAERIRLKDEAGATAADRRRGALLTATANDRERIGLLSTKGPGVLTEFRLGAGPSLLYIERHVAEPSFAERQGRYVSPGAALAAGLDWTFPYYLLKVSLDGQLGVYRNAADTAEPALLSKLYGLSLGTFW